MEFAQELGSLPRGSKYKMRRRRGSLRTLSVDVFRRLYFDERKSLQDLAHVFGTSRTAVHRWFHRHKSELSQKLRSGGGWSKCALDEAFFETWTPEMAYVLGVFATDGNVGKNRVSLTSTDLELVEKVQHLMRTSHPIRSVAPRGYSRKTQYKLDISSKWLARNLTELGIWARKSRTLRFPTVPEECVRHFLRGCWDGDGSFYLEGKKFVASFVSGSKQFIIGVAGSLRKAGITGQRPRRPSRTRLEEDANTVSIYEDRRGGKVVCYQLKLFSRDVLALGTLLYEGVPESMYLTRKYEVYRMAASNQTLRQSTQRHLWSR